MYVRNVPITLEDLSGGIDVVEPLPKDNEGGGKVASKTTHKEPGEIETRQNQIFELRFVDITELEDALYFFARTSATQT